MNSPKSASMKAPTDVTLPVDALVDPRQLCRFRCFAAGEPVKRTPGKSVACVIPGARSRDRVEAMSKGINWQAAEDRSSSVVRVSTKLKTCPIAKVNFSYMRRGLI